MGALFVKVGLGMLKTIVTEKLFVMLISRAVVSSLEKLAASTKTDVDDVMIQPIVEAVKKYY